MLTFIVYFKLHSRYAKWILKIKQIPVKESLWQSAFAFELRCGAMRNRWTIRVAENPESAAGVRGGKTKIIPNPHRLRNAFHHGADASVNKIKFITVKSARKIVNYDLTTTYTHDGLELLFKCTRKHDCVSRKLKYKNPFPAFLQCQLRRAHLRAFGSSKLLA